MKSTIKLVQLNLWQGKLLQAAVEFLEREDADIVCLQEVFSWSTEQGVLDMASSLEVIVEQLDYEYVFFAPTFSFDVAGEKVKFGNVILSKLPLEGRQVVFTNNNYFHVEEWDRDHKRNTRNALVASVEHAGRSFKLVNHHGFHDLDPMGNERSVEAMKVLIDELKQVNEEIVLCGDLNVIAGSNTMKLFNGWLTDLTAEYQIQDTLSSFGKVRNVPCDHVLVSDGIKVHRFQTTEDLVSDHKPLICEFKIK